MSANAWDLVQVAVLLPFVVWGLRRESKRWAAQQAAEDKARMRRAARRVQP